MMYPMRNRHTKIVCRGLHKLRKEMRARKYKVVYKNGWWQLEEEKRTMMEKGELQKVELANDLLVMLESVSPQDQIDILQLALDSMLAKKRLNEPQKEHIRTWMIHSKTQQAVSYLVTLEDATFSCTCPDFRFRGGDCKHIKRVKMKLAGEKQKNKLPGVE